MTTAKGRTGGKGLFAREQEERNQPPATAFIRSAPRPRRPRRRPRGKKSNHRPLPHQVKKFEAPTPSDSQARRTRALISQVKRRVWSGHNGTAVSTPHAPRLRRSAVKRYVRAVPSRASDARPPANQSRRVVSVGRRLRLARPPIDPEQKIARRFSSGTYVVSPGTSTITKTESPLRQKSLGHGHLRSRCRED